VNQAQVQVSVQAQVVKKFHHHLLQPVHLQQVQVAQVPQVQYP
jgi:hypothetical protein